MLELFYINKDKSRKQDSWKEIREHLYSLNTTKVNLDKPFAFREGISSEDFQELYKFFFSRGYIIARSPKVYN